MLVYRIVLSKFAGELTASGRAARWNPNEIKMIYTASSRSLACLENAVHRSQAGLSRLFTIMVIKIPDNIKIKAIDLSDLFADWADYRQMHHTQSLGEKWIKEHETAILQVPSSIIQEEHNYLLNPEHKDFKQIKTVDTKQFVFDQRIKQ